jgi:hypothetical protein
MIHDKHSDIYSQLCDTLNNDTASRQAATKRGSASQSPLSGPRAKAMCRRPSRPLGLWRNPGTQGQGTPWQGEAPYGYLRCASSSWSSRSHGSAPRCWRTISVTKGNKPTSNEALCPSADPLVAGEVSRTNSRTRKRDTPFLPVAGYTACTALSLFWLCDCNKCRKSHAVVSAFWYNHVIWLKNTRISRLSCYKYVS